MEQQRQIQVQESWLDLWIC